MKQGNPGRCSVTEASSKSLKTKSVRTQATQTLEKQHGGGRREGVSCTLLEMPLCSAESRTLEFVNVTREVSVNAWAPAALKS